MERSLLYKIYRGARFFKGDSFVVNERHRHRYEFNSEYHKIMEEKGLVISGVSPDGRLVEATEIKDHPFFIRTQFRLEYKSRPTLPHPIFSAFVRACLNF